VTGAAAATVLARLTWTRLWRGRSMWVTGALLLLPLAVAVLGGEHNDAWPDTFTMIVVLLTVIPPLHLATAVSDEVDDLTYTYLWSRPFPRWALLAGKAAAIVPLLVVTLLAVTTAAFALAGGDELGPALLAIGVGTIATGGLALGMGALVPKYPLASVVSYLLLADQVIGNIPFAVRHLSLTYHVRAIAGMAGDTDELAAQLGLGQEMSLGVSLIWCLAMAGAWIGVAAWRISAAEHGKK
jgi:hypothetical protein